MTFTAGQLPLLLLQQHLVALGGKLGVVEATQWASRLGQADELLSVETGRIIDHTGSVHHPDGLVVTKQDLIASQVTVWSRGLHLADILLSEAVSSVNTEDVLSDGKTGHSVSIVGDTSEKGSTLASSE